MLQDESSVLKLRMKTPTAPMHLGHDVISVKESVLAMRQQEELYRCRDFLDRRRRQKEPMELLFDLASTNEAVDEQCREKMIEWSYRVCDHFRTSRVLVAFAFSFLDRFMDRVCCDRTSFKLAAMTCLYMATKLFNAKQISIVSLAELSRGEFTVDHIAQMERSLLHKLSWRLNPPTIQSFVNELQAFLPFDNSFMGKAIYHRANFFAELSVYDYDLITESRLKIAVACLLNSMEGIDDSVYSHELQHEFLLELNSFLPDIDAEEIDLIQSRLWYLYSCSAQLEEDDVLPTDPVPQSSKSDADTASYSPVSVHMRRY